MMKDTKSKIAKFQTTMKSYSKQLLPCLNSPLSLELAMKPFPVKLFDSPSRTILMGHLLECLSLEFSETDIIDVIDITTCIWELGHESAGDFLDEIPLYILQD